MVTVAISLDPPRVRRPIKSKPERPFQNHRVQGAIDLRNTELPDV